MEESAKLKEQLLRNSELTLKPGDFQRSKIEVVDNSLESRQEVISKYI